MSIFAVTYDYRPNNPLIAENGAAHLEFLRGLSHAGQLISAGPFSDSQGGELLLLRLSSTNTGVSSAIALLDVDPYFRAGCLRARTFRQWDPSPSL
ncbi:YciI family protein [Corynebacterium flavescens]|uniref:YCII-related domain-containing protein n=1 Tax=Corynebacterium flavescens TaxID=28028 RepID=A0A1L7CMJ1_CORFL|nr:MULTISPECIES: YciI family protein [Corynebacterium]APT87041.1 hypothetical protein CFLV_07465 [Corynebacterium flavescens]KAA8721868.1 hypothetical protein F4V60_07300 [Corynebacterium flavescens]MDN6098622.1 YciI family protein [Corynebacterium flavescens]MDN6198599.1 YciI family protein [Corynebacterium flavescens]MDN6225992.1 YciI family protein [Corynebacterium flavescens]